MKIAIVHEWFVNYAGSERVVEQLLNLYPEADLFALVDFLEHDERRFLRGKRVTTSFIQKLPLARKKFRSYLPLMPIAVEQFDLSSYDLVISSSHAVAKGVITHPYQTHICYCHSPIRYAWDMQHQYLTDGKLERGFKSLLARLVLHYIRLWDLRTANGVDHFIANSNFIAKRIHKIYRRESAVIHPPVNIDVLKANRAKGDFYLTASRLVSYKKSKLVVEAFNKMPQHKLVVIGDGPEMPDIRSIAGPNIQVLGYQSDDVLREYLGSAKGFLFAAEEDFGILPVEALASGTPVLAYGRGGVLDTVNSNDGDPLRTGVFFQEQSVDSIMSAVSDFEEIAEDIVAENCRRSAERFSEKRFRREFSREIERILERS